MFLLLSNLALKIYRVLIRFIDNLVVAYFLVHLFRYLLFSQQYCLEFQT